MSQKLRTRASAMRSPLVLVLGLLAGTSLVATGCDRRGADKKSDDKAAAKDAAGDKKEAVAKAEGDEKGEEKAVDDSPCGKYEAALCEAAGKESAPCSAMGALSNYLPPEACDAGLANLDFTKKKIDSLQAKCTELVEKLCKDIGEDTESCTMVKDQVPKFPADRCDGMMENYDAVLADLKRREDANKPLDDAKQAKIAAADAPTFGPEDAKVTIVEFSDFQCPYCTRAADAVTKIKEKYGDKVRVVFRQFPLSFHKDAHLASQAALAAHEQGKFWEYHDLLFKNQRALSREDLEKYAKELSLDLKKFNKALDDGTYKKQVDDDMALGTEVSVSGTPTMFLNGARVKNATAFEAIEPEIEAALAKG